MKSILEELYEGNICPDEWMISKHPEYHPLIKRISGMLEMWRNKLSEENYSQLEKLLDLRSEASSMETSEAFMNGFKLGALIIAEVLNGKEELVKEDD